MAEKYDIELLGQIPLSIPVGEGGDQGQPIVSTNDQTLSPAFHELAGQVARQVSIVNDQKAELATTN